MDKELFLLVSQNGWEYTGLVKIKYKDNYKLSTTSENSLDSNGEKAPDTITLDNSIVISFDEGFEVGSKNE